MKIFLSYASQDRAMADAINGALLEQGHDMFFDRDDLPPGEEFHIRIRKAIEQSDLFVFLVSGQAIDPGSYTLTELDIAQKTIKRPSGRLLPVLLHPTSFDALPAFLKSVTVLETQGNIPAAVADAVHRIALDRRRSLLWKAGAGILLLGLLAAGGWYLRSTAAPAVEVTGKDGAPAVLIPAGSFVMGDDEESPRRELFLDSFHIDRFEVTTARFARFLAATGSVRPPDGWEELDLARGGELPVVGVDWNDAAAYCKWVGRRLPTDAEWEKAARGTDGRRYPWGNDPPTPERANFQNSSPDAYDGGLSKVGSHPAGRSPFGVEDLAGNVGEWVADWYSERFPTADVRNPQGPDSGTTRVIRGGGRYEPAERLMATKRYSGSPDLRADDIGFRCARDAR
ncbi:MAG: SUMF1/EgtB/PvdO family nonheme iron enzyme [Betaproteobacteria bacterium]